jgi:hypothetical protein
MWPLYFAVTVKSDGGVAYLVFEIVVLQGSMTVADHKGGIAPLYSELEHSGAKSARIQT